MRPGRFLFRPARFSCAVEPGRALEEMQTMRAHGARATGYGIAHIIDTRILHTTSRAGPAFVLFTIHALAPFSAGDGAETEHRKGPRPVSYKINLRFRRFGCGTGQITGLIVYYIGLPVPFTTRALSVSRAHYLA